MQAKKVPRIALFSALSFVIMMFNIPLPGGTTGHAVGAAAAAIILGPWTAILSISVALVIQAFFFGNGGILTLGANIFNMAIVIPFVSAAVFKLFDRADKTTIQTKALLAAAAGYVGINAAALTTSIELGIQPLLFHTADGQALYFPYGLNVAVPAMMLGHLTLAGFAEALVSALTVSWVLRNDTAAATTKHNNAKNESVFFKRSLQLIAVLVFLSPLGLLTPGTAWGEWSREELHQLGLGYIPTGFDKWASFWSAPLGGYTVSTAGNPTLTYVFSGIVGVVLSFAVLFLIMWIARKLFRKTNTHVLH